jgi:hypothetical protein
LIKAWISHSGFLWYYLRICAVKSTRLFFGLTREEKSDQNPLQNPPRSLNAELKEGLLKKVKTQTGCPGDIIGKAEESGPVRD